MGPQLRLEVDTSVDAARAVRTRLPSLVPAGVSDPRLADVLLAASELVTNAVFHAAGPIGVEAWRSVAGAWRVEVLDGSPLLPAPRAREVDELGGHGLEIIAAVTSAWGSERVAGGKRCWFEVEAGRRRACRAHRSVRNGYV